MLSDVLESIAPLPGFEIWNLTTEAGSSPGDIQTTRDTKESNSVDDAMIQDTWTELRPWLDQDVFGNIPGQQCSLNCTVQANVQMFTGITLD